MGGVSARWQTLQMNVSLRDCQLRRLSSHPWSLWMGITALALSMLVACGQDDGNDACGPARRERVDGASALHLLSNATEPSYLSDPPTSGPHRSRPAPKGVQSNPLDRTVQVSVLEQGGVLIQYRQESDAGSLADLAKDNDEVVIAPNTNLPAPIVATSWAYKQTCKTFNRSVLLNFIKNRPPVEPSHE